MSRHVHDADCVPDVLERLEGTLEQMADALSRMADAMSRMSDRLTDTRRIAAIQLTDDGAPVIGKAEVDKG